MAHKPIALLPLLALIAACSTGTEPAPSNNNPIDTIEPPSVNRPYDAARGGVQITAIYYDQGKNFSIEKLNDEWIVLESDQPHSLEGWKLDANDQGQRYSLKPIKRKLIIYTQDGPGYQSDSTMSLGKNSWIWNNTEPDTAWLYDEKGALIDAMTYEGK